MGKQNPHRELIAALLRDEEGITNTRIRELIAEARYQGAKTILDDHLPLRIRCYPICYPRTWMRPARNRSTQRRGRTRVSVGLRNLDTKGLRGVREANVIAEQSLEVLAQA